MDSSLRLRPMDLRDILDETFDLYRENFILFFTIAAVVFLPIQVMIGLVSPSRQFGSPGVPGLGLAFLYIPMGFLYGIAYYADTAALTAAISERYLGNTITVRDAYQRILSRFGSFVGTLILTGVVLLGGVMLLALMFALAAGLAALSTALGAVAMILAGFVFFAGAIYFGFMISFVGPVFVVEGLGGLPAIRRSMQLFQFSALKAIGTLLLILMIVFFITLILSTPVAVLTGVTAGLNGAVPRWAMLLSNIYTGVIQALLQPIQTTVLILLYYDIRIRREGFDLEMMANELRGASSSVFPNEVSFEASAEDESV